jgi:hypothetical protein
MKLVFSQHYSNESLVLKLKTEKDECLEMIEELISSSNNNQGFVYVTFLKFEGEENEQSTILTSEVEEFIIEFVETRLNCSNWKELMLCIFEFKSFKEAFEWCAELQKDF